ncbi:MAG TPA: hypothetical protein PKC49_08460 [Phycisphaerae bacterium]|nr:hypothetical protein [Phycisphaerae bacterium]
MTSDHSRDRASSLRRWALIALGGLAFVVIGLALSDYLTPDRYVLRIAAPRGAAHDALARALVEHAARYGVELTVVPEASGAGPMDLLADGRADLCLMSGLPPVVEGVAEVVRLGHESLHLVARPALAAGDLDALRGARVNLGPPEADWRDIAELVFTFAGLKPGADYVVSHLSAEALLATPTAELPDVVATVGGDCPAEVAHLVRHCGYRPLKPGFLAALAQLRPELELATQPAGIYCPVPPVPMETTPVLTVDLRLVARSDASPRAVKALLAAVLDGEFGRRAGLPGLSEDRLGDDRRLRLHAGTLAFMHRHDPWLTPEFVEETEDLRNLLAAIGFGVFVSWRALKRKHRRIVREAVREVHVLEREALRLETSDAAETEALLRVRHELAHVKRRLVEQVVSHERFADPFLTELLAQIDALRRSVLEAVAHRAHGPAKEARPPAPERGVRPSARPLHVAAGADTVGLR